MADVYIGDKAAVTPVAADQLFVLKDGAIGRATISATAPAIAAAIDASSPAEAALAAALAGNATAMESLGISALSAKSAIDVREHGAVGDGTITDDATAIQAALDAGLATGRRVIAIGSFRIDSKIVIKSDADFSLATINVYGNPAVAVEVSTGNATNPTTPLYNSVIFCPRVIENKNRAATGAAWSGVTSIGLRLVNCYSCTIVVGNVKSFHTNLQVTSFDTGSAYNNFFLGHLEHGKINLYVGATGSGNTGWVNENNFIGGRMSHYSGESDGTSGCNHIYIHNTAISVNNNVFIKPSIEGAIPEYHIKCGGGYNVFMSPRWEATTPKLHYFGTSAEHGTRNMVLGGYLVEQVVVTTSGTIGGYNSIFGPSTQDVDAGAGGKPLLFSNPSSSSAAIRKLYESGQAKGADNWAVYESAQTYRGKIAASANAHIYLDFINSRIYFGNGTDVPTINIGMLGSSTVALAESNWVPGADNNKSLGVGSFRWSEIYAGNATINTSDEREKQQIASIDERVFRAWAKVSFVQYKWNKAVDEKGDKARIHFGVIAQRVIDAFASEGLDAADYGLLCYDEWPALLDAAGSELAPAGSRYGIRYDEALALECAYLRYSLVKRISR